METYPIILEGELWGKLTVDPRGSRTVFQAECRMREELTRISVYGGGKEGYLGLLTPEGGKLCLRKTLSRATIRDFPSPIEFAGVSGLPNGGAASAPAEISKAVSKPEREDGTETGSAFSSEQAPGPGCAGPETPEPALEVAGEQGPSEKEKEGMVEPHMASELCAPSASTDTVDADEDTAIRTPSTWETPKETLDWYSSPDGALVCFDGASSRIALPLGDPRIPPEIPGEEREIDGTRYLVYHTRNGRIVRDGISAIQG